MGKEKVKNKNLNLFKEFPPTDPKEWKEQIVKDLRGADYEKLVWKTGEGFYVEPFYTENDLKNLSYLTGSLPGHFPFVRGNSQITSEWDICEEVPPQSGVDSNEHARTAISNGADALTFSVTSEELNTVLNDIPLGDVKLNFNIDMDKLDILDSLVNQAETRKYNTSSLTGAFYLGPLNDLFSNGALPQGANECFQSLKEFISETDSKTPEYKSISVNSDVFTRAGAGIVQELALTMAMGSEYLVQLNAKGIGPDIVSNKIVFIYSIGPDYFMEIAKLRAARLLWAIIVDKFGTKDPSSCKMTMHCKTSQKNDDDPYKKMLSDTTESMAAITGGCDSLTINPYHKGDGTEGENYNRLTRNTQLVLRDESYLNKIVDPGSGSYYIENLTDSLARDALNLFKSIEEKGGYIKCVENSFINEMIDKV